MDHENTAHTPEAEKIIPARRILLFRRNFRAFTGGHLKVWHYFQHVRASQLFEPEIYLTPESFSVAGNPWNDVAPPPRETWQPQDADLLFLAGLDWEAVPDPAPQPVINLIQGIRHSKTGGALRGYLSRPAVRICVSGEVAASILATGKVNGPVHVIPNGIDLEEIPCAEERDIEVLIAGAKNPSFAKALHERLGAEGLACRLLTGKIPRADFLNLLSRSAVAVTLPLQQEGFFLPALEAMAAGAVVVCPDCVGNRSFCHDGRNCFFTPYDIEAVAQATLRATRLEPGARAAILLAAKTEAQQHGLEAERTAFLRILDAL